MELTPCQEVIGFILESSLGGCFTSKYQFEKTFRDSEYGVPDSLVVQCLKCYFKTTDFSIVYDDVKKMVEGKELSSFGNSLLGNNPGLIKLICQYAHAKSKKIKLVIKKDEWAVSVGRGTLISFPFTKDMEEPANRLAEYTKLFFSKPAYDIDFMFHGNYGLSRNMDITPAHIKLLSKITKKHFAEKGRVYTGRERNGRLVVTMSRIGWKRSGVYYNAVIEFFESYRGTVIYQGEQPSSKSKKTYKEVLEHTLAHPDDVLTDEKPVFHYPHTMKKTTRKRGPYVFGGPEPMTVRKSRILHG